MRVLCCIAILLAGCASIIKECDVPAGYARFAPSASLTQETIAIDPQIERVLRNFPAIWHSNAERRLAICLPASSDVYDFCGHVIYYYAPTQTGWTTLDSMVVNCEVVVQ